MSDRLIAGTACYLLWLLFLVVTAASWPVFLLSAFLVFWMFKKSLSEKSFFSLRLTTMALPCAVGIGSIIFSADVFDAQRVSDFLVGDSDSKLYYDVGVSIAQSVSPLDQLKVWDLGYLDHLQNTMGMIFKDTGFFWFIGFLFSLVGADNGVAALMVLNILMLSQSIIWLCTKSAGLKRQKPWFITLMVSLFYLNANVSASVFSCRKDILLLFVFAGCLRLISRGRWTLGLLMTLPVLSLRAPFVVPTLAPFIIRIFPFIRKMSARKLLVFALLILFLVPLLYDGFAPVIGKLDADPDAAFSLKRDLGGSAALLNSKFLQFVYVLLTPVVPLSVQAYEADPLSWVALLAGISNIAFLYSFANTALWQKRGVYREALFDAYFLCTMTLYMAFAFLTAMGVSSGLYGVIEPRYKLAIWMMQLVLLISFPKPSRGKVARSPRSTRLEESPACTN
jgi:hypothetical protein